MPQLETLRIEHYKGFFEEETLEFAIPDGKNPGSGLTLIVGPNNAGKTTLLEALLLGESGGPLSKGKRFTEFERHPNDNPKITINKCVYSNTGGGSVIKIINQSQPHGIEFEVVQSRRLWDHTSDTSLDSKAFLDATRQQNMRGTKISSTTAAALKDIDEDPARKAELHRLMAQIIPDFANWTIDSSSQGDYVKYRVGNSEHGANLLGEGVMSALHICIHLVSGDNAGVLIIDEPELSLHPNAQKSLSSILSEMSKDKQIILCTHSPYFVNWKDLVDGARFIRLNKAEDKEGCTVSSLEENKTYLPFISNSLSEWQKPQLLDVAAKEILFAEKVLFVEGQEDVGLIRRWAAKENTPLNFDIFGYGVGGYCNIRLFLQMAKDLGIKRVGALYDSGKDANAFFDADQDTFSSPSFLLKKLPTEDIRDKNPKVDCTCGNCTCDIKDKKTKEGCFDTKGNLKVKRQKEFIDIISEFIQHFNS